MPFSARTAGYGLVRPGQLALSGRTLARASCTAAAAVGALALAGWTAGVPRLYAWTGGAGATKPYTALATIALAVALAGPAGRVVARRAIAAAALAVVLVMLVENLTGFSTGLDGTLFGGSVSSHRLGGRMAQNTAIALALVAVAALAATAPGRAAAVAEWSAVGAVGIGLVGGGGYLFGPAVPAAVVGYATMSLGTAVAIVLLGAAVVAVEHRGRVHRLLGSAGAAGRTTRALLAPISIIPLVVGAAASGSDLTVSQARTAAWLFAVAIAGLLVIAVLAFGLIEHAREQERARHDAELDQARAQERRRHTLEMMVAVAEEERNQIATDLHDDTIQVMTAALLTIDSARRGVATGDPVRVDRALGHARATLGEAIERTRRLMFGLRPPALTEQGLRAAVMELATETGAATGADVDVDVVDARFSEHVEGLAYRTVRELVVNARKHARARRIAIEIAAREQTLYCVVHDDGVGFDPTSVRERPDRHLHLGLDAVEERVVLAGGTLEIDSAPMRGARVRFAIPLVAGAAA
jgi:signal transduction histidine kinase